MTRLARVLAGGGLAALVFLGWASPAGAVFEQNTIGCAGSAVITDPDGATYDVDAEDVAVDVPREGTAAYEGSIDVTTHNHVGAVDLDLGGQISVEMGSWGPSRNDGDETTDSGTKVLPDVLKIVPPGSYDVHGFHRGDEGLCVGSVRVNLLGSPLSDPIGIAAIAGTTLFAVGLIASWRASLAKVG